LAHGFPQEAASVAFVEGVHDFLTIWEVV
jgi:hypothetical protein